MLWPDRINREPWPLRRLGERGQMPGARRRPGAGWRRLRLLVRPPGPLDRPCPARRSARLRAMGMAAALAVLAALVLALGVDRPVWSPAYALAALRTYLAQHPAAWVGRTVRVRGMVEPCPWWGTTARLRYCAGEPLVLVAGPADRVAAPLPLRRRAPNAILAALCALPLLRDLVAPSRAVPLFSPTRFRVQLQRLPAQACSGCAPCYVAVLLDAVPWGAGNGPAGE